MIPASGPLRLHVARLCLLLCLAVLAGCAPRDDLRDVPAPIGRFSLGYNIVVGKDAVKGPFSREASTEDLETALKLAIQERMGRYTGDKLYHLGINIDAYVLALPGVPVLASPKSALIVSANVWDDAAGRKLNAEPKRLTVLEYVSGGTFLGSGLTQTKEQQLRNLTVNSARAIENWLIDNRAWFGDVVAADIATAGAAPVAPVGGLPAGEGVITVTPLEDLPAIVPAPGPVTLPAAVPPPRRPAN